MQQTLENLKSKIIELILKNKELHSVNGALREELRVSQMQRGILEEKIKKTSDQISDLLVTHFNKIDISNNSLNHSHDHENT